MTETRPTNPAPTFYAERKFLPNEFAKWILKDSGEHFVTLRDTEIIHRYSDGIYKPDGSTYIKESVEQSVDGKSITTRSVSEVLGHIQRKTYINRDEFDQDANQVVLKNGVLNTKTFEFIEHDPSMYFLLMVPVVHDIDATCPKFDKFLSEILPDEVERQTIIELFGYCLIKNYGIQKWFMFLGDGGNGKGTLLSVLRTFLGVNNISAVELQEFEKPFSVAELYGRLANIVGDLSAKELYHSGRLKSLTGGDLLLAEKKFQNPFNFVNHAKLIYSANELPRTFDGTYAFWRRVMLINFTEKFTEEGEIKDLWEELTTEDELSGILNRAIEGLKRLAKNHRFSKNNSTEEIEEFYIRTADPVAAFFMDCVETTNNHSDFISFKSLHTAFVCYCKQYRFRDLSIKKFNSSVRNNFKLTETREKNVETEKQERVWSGIILSIAKEYTSLPSICDEKTEMTENKHCSSFKTSEGLKRRFGHLGIYSSGLNVMEFIQTKILEYGDESDHAYNIIEALLEKTGVSQEEAEHCVTMHRQGHRVYIPREEE